MSFTFLKTYFLFICLIYWFIFKMLLKLKIKCKAILSEIKSIVMRIISIFSKISGKIKWNWVVYGQWSPILELEFRFRLSIFIIWNLINIKYMHNFLLFNVQANYTIFLHCLFCILCNWHPLMELCSRALEVNGCKKWFKSIFTVKIFDKYIIYVYSSNIQIIP